MVRRSAPPVACPAIESQIPPSLPVLRSRAALLLLPDDNGSLVPRTSTLPKELKDDRDQADGPERYEEPLWPRVHQAKESHHKGDHTCGCSAYACHVTHMYPSLALCHGTGTCVRYSSVAAPTRSTSRQRAGQSGLLSRGCHNACGTRRHSVACSGIVAAGQRHPEDSGTYVDHAFHGL